MPLFAAFLHTGTFMSTTTDTWPLARLDASAPPMVGSDLDGRIVFWSAAAEALFSWTAPEVTGRAPLFIPDALRQEWQLQVRRVVESGEATPATETQRVSREGRSIWVVHSASPVRGPSGHIVGVLDTMMDITALKLIDEESRALAQVRERELIAMDLHDGLVQSLFALVLNLSTTEDPATAVSNARAEVERLIEETRTYLFNLKAREISPRDLRAGLAVLADGLRLNGTLDVQLSVDPSIETVLDGEARGHVLYLVREAVSNVLRHAHATRVEIAVSSTADLLLVRVTDNGHGFAPGPKGHSRHRGLRNMAERARLIGGRLDVTSSLGAGTTVCLKMRR